MATPNYDMGSGLASSSQWNQSNINNWDYGGWHNNAYSGCHQQVYAAGISPSSGYNHVQRSFPVSSTKPHVTQTQPTLHDGTVGYSQEMHVGVPPEQQSQLCEKKELSLEQLAFLKKKYDEAQDNLNQNKECHESSNEKDIHNLCRKLLADLKHIQEERKTMELEAQRKHAEEEIHKELEHFLYNAFNLFEEEQQKSEHAPKSFTIHVPHLFVGGSIECSMSNNKIELTSLPDSELCGKPGEAQQVNNQQLNKLITDAGRKQWDPGILNTIIDVPPVVKWSSLEVLLPCSMLDAANSIQQGRNVTLVLHFWPSIFNDIQYCQIFHKCNAMRSQLYWHQDIKLNGIALWRITFKPP